MGRSKEAIQRKREARNSSSSLMVNTYQGIVDAQRRRDYNTGLDIGFAWHEVQSASNTLANMITQVILMVLMVEGLPIDWQVERLKTILALGEKKHHFDKRLKDAIDDLHQAIRAARPVLGQMVYEADPIDQEYVEFLVQFGLRLSDGVNSLIREQRPDEQGVELRACIAEYGGAGVLETLDTMREKATRKLGAASEPHPVTKYILDETRYLARLHNLKTRPDKMEALMQKLRERNDVKVWQGIKARRGFNITVELRKQGVAVQTFEALCNLNRSELGETLRQHEKNNPRYLEKAVE